MKLSDALQKWSSAATCEEAKGKFVQTANDRPLTNQLRHCKDADLVVVACDHVPGQYAALVKVTPVEPKPHIAADGDAPLPQPPRRQPFYLFVG